MCSRLYTDSKSTLIEGQTPAGRLLQERQYSQTSQTVNRQTLLTEEIYKGREKERKKEKG